MADEVVLCGGIKTALQGLPHGRHSVNFLYKLILNIITRYVNLLSSLFLFFVVLGIAQRASYLLSMHPILLDTLPVLFVLVCVSDGILCFCLG
jgi:hypothetical protein